MAFLQYIKNFLNQLFAFFRDVYSDNGHPSSSRVLTTYLAIISSAILWKVIDHIVKLTDQAMVVAWLGSLPLIISALVLFFTAPYGVNVGSGTVTDLVSVLKGKNQQ